MYENVTFGQVVSKISEFAIKAGFRTEITPDKSISFYFKNDEEDFFSQRITFTKKMYNKGDWDYNGEEVILFINDYLSITLNGDD